MNLYKLSFDSSRARYVDRYDYYDSLVVIAKDKDEARLIHPYNFSSSRRNCWQSNCWVHSPEEVIVTYLGVADPSLNSENPIIITSFNAG